MAKRIDWSKAKTEYVNNPTLTMADIAARYGTTLGTVQGRSHVDKWTDAREARTKLLEQNATQKSVSLAVQELAKYNEDDLAVAKILRAKCLDKLNAENKDNLLTAKDLRSLAGAVESAQRVARLALGAATENPMMGTPAFNASGLDDLDLEAFTDDELSAFNQLVTKAIRAPRRGDPPTSRESVQ